VNQHSNYRRVIYSPIKVVLRPSVKFKMRPSKIWIAREALLRAGEVHVSLQRKPRRLRACLFGLWLAGCAGEAAVQKKLLFQILSFGYLAGWLAVS
jgi:hypothetical protein